MTIVRVGSTGKYADGWDLAFKKSGGKSNSEPGKAAGAKPSASAVKTAKSGAKASAPPPKSAKPAPSKTPAKQAVKKTPAKKAGKK